jgi:hypothetical protein
MDGIRSMHEQMRNVQKCLVRKPRGKKYIGNRVVNWKTDERNKV